MISLKKYLDSYDSSTVAAPEPALEREPGAAANDILSVTMECYRAALLAVGRAAVQICPGLGVDVQSGLRGLERRLSVSYTADSVKRTEQQVEVQLNEWGARTFNHFKTQADDVKELLIALAGTAESVGSRDKGYSTKFVELTGRLEQIADLSDLRQIRVSLVARVAELKSSVEQMTRENQQLVDTLRTQVAVYETKLKSAETLALKDQLTNLANRRSIEDRIELYIEDGHEFCVAMLDLDGFKEVNDSHGHVAGDDLLKQFATELKSNARAGDLVGRWGGDEFIVILSCNLKTAQAHIDRLQEWVFGKYTVRGANEAAFAVQVTGSIGAAQWRRGQTPKQLIAEADSKMFAQKKLARRKRG